MTDRATRAALKRLDRAKGFVLDLDGTLVLGDRNNLGLRALPGAAAFLGHLRKRGLPYLSFTNGTVRPPRDYVPKLAAAGLSLDATEIMTPATVAADYLSRRGFKRVMVLGGDGVSQPLVEAGIEVVRPPDYKNVDAIFVGWFRDFTMSDIEAACEAVWGGAKLFSASLAPFFASANGRTLGTSCAIVGAIRQITGCRARVLGKPALEGLRYAGRRLGVAVGELAVIGDDPALEVAMAHRGGALSIAVTTGISKREDFLALPRPARPHILASNIGAVLKLWRAGKA